MFMIHFKGGVSYKFRKSSLYTYRYVGKTNLVRKVWNCSG